MEFSNRCVELWTQRLMFQNKNIFVLKTEIELRAPYLPNLYSKRNASVLETEDNKKVWIGHIVYI